MSTFFGRAFEAFRIPGSSLAVVRDEADGSSEYCNRARLLQIDGGLVTVEQELEMLFSLGSSPQCDDPTMHESCYAGVDAGLLQNRIALRLFV